MEKIKYIKGNQEHAREIENYFVSQGVGLKRHFSYALETFAYFVNPDTGFVDCYGVDSWEFKTFVETGAFEELKYPYKESKPKLKVIQGVPRRGDEVIALLKSLGGVNDFCGGIGFDGIDINAYYFITKQSSIGCIRMDDEFFKDYDLEVLTLQEKVGPKPKLKVIQGVPFRGDEVIALLESLGGKRTTPISGSGSNGYYYINEIQQIDFRIKDSDFFDKYDIEILTLPEGVVKPKLKVIQGDPDRGVEVIALLESLGGYNLNGYKGRNDSCYYFIDAHSERKPITFNLFGTDFFNDFDLEVLTLPEKVVKPKLKVIRGRSDRGDVIETLESLGGQNFYKLEGNDNEYLYYIDGDGFIRGLDDADNFFKGYDLEEIMLPEEYVKPKLQVVLGNSYRRDEVIKLLESLGGVNKRCCDGKSDLCYYFIDPSDPEKAIDYLRRESTFFDKFDLEVLTLPEKVEKPKMKVIKGDIDRGDEVIALLESLGGVNEDGCVGSAADFYYYIDSSVICGRPMTCSEFFDDYDIEVLTLPEKVEKPKLQVVRGTFDRRHEVIKLLESLGGINEHGYEAYDEDCYYFIDPKSEGNIIDFFNYKKACFFDDYDIEVLTLPGEEESTNEPETSKFEPFVSKVLVRNNPGYLWMPAFFFSEESEGGARWYHIVGTHDTYRECIPYEGNEELAFTSNDVRSM